MEASRASGEKDGVGGTRDEGCGVQKGQHGGGPVGGESPPTLDPVESREVAGIEASNSAFEQV